LDLQLILEKNIQVKNSLLDGSVSGNLQVKGPPDNPVLLGRITADRNTKLIVKDRVFEIQSGVIDFNDPNEINPNLYITATTRINEYDITVLAQGPSKNMTIRFSSVPPLAENDIISLIALGVITSHSDQTFQARQQQNEQAGAEIGGAVLAAPINKQIEATGFAFSVTQQYDSYRSVSVPKITLSRRLTDKVKISGSRPVGDTQAYDVRMEYQINSNYTAIGSYENRGSEELSNGLQQTTESTGVQQNIFGLDIEFKREFK
jgi:translocation and assembly module TamB